MPKLYEGAVSLVETKAGSDVFTLKPKADGKYSAENTQAIVDAIVKAAASLEHWKLWLDFPDAPKLVKPVTAKQLQAFVKKADTVELVLVRKPFPQPKLKLTVGDGTKPAKADNGKREL